MANRNNYAATLGNVLSKKKTFRTLHIIILNILEITTLLQFLNVNITNVI